MILQFEVSGLCNRSCDYCLRSYAEVCKRNLSFEEFRKVVEEAQSYDRIEKILLYGFGEPGMNPEIGRIVRFSSSIAEVILLTNGLSLKKLSKDELESVTLGFSVHENVREAISTLKSLKNAESKVELEVVLDKHNVYKLKEVVNQGLDVSSSNLLAYDRGHYSRVAYCEVSRRCVEIVEDFAREVGWERLKEVVDGMRHFEPKSLEVYSELSERASREGYQLNLSWIVENRERIAIAKKAEIAAKEAVEVGKEAGVKVTIPSFFADSVSRECPYRNTVFLRADCTLSPCMEFSYSHKEYVNDHEKFVENVRYGSFREALDDFTSLKDVNRYPWCGDCQLKQFCWFAEKAMDCYGYKPSCSECLYSTGIVSCRQ